MVASRGDKKATFADSTTTLDTAAAYFANRHFQTTWERQARHKKERNRDGASQQATKPEQYLQTEATKAMVAAYKVSCSYVKKYKLNYSSWKAKVLLFERAMTVKTDQDAKSRQGLGTVRQSASLERLEMAPLQDGPPRQQERWVSPSGLWTPKQECSTTCLCHTQPIAVLWVV